MEKIINLLCAVAELSEVSITKNRIDFIDRGCPHKPVALPKGKMGIYIF